MYPILNLHRYPLHQPWTRRYAALVDECQRSLSENGSVSLHGLMHPARARAGAVALSSAFQSSAFHHQREHNIYFDDDLHHELSAGCSGA